MGRQRQDTERRADTLDGVASSARKVCNGLTIYAVSRRQNAQNGPWRHFSVKTCKHTAGTNGPQNGEYGARKDVMKNGR